MSILKYSNKCNPAASAANMKYITRDSAADSISFHNLPELEAADRIDAKSRAINYAEERELEEECRVRGNENGTPRNHNRMIISFDRKESTELAKEEVHKFLDKNFPNQKAVVSIHQDRDHTHSHVWFDCRDVGTDRKSRLNPKDFYSLDEKWAKQYDERYKTSYEREYREKKDETREWKKAEYERTQGAAGKRILPLDKPHRHNHNKAQILRDKEIREHGYNKEPADRDKPIIERGQPRAEREEPTRGRGEPEMEDFIRRIDRTERTLDEAFSDTQGVLDATERTKHAIVRTEQTIARGEPEREQLQEAANRFLQQRNREIERSNERSIERDDGRGR